MKEDDFRFVRGRGGAQKEDVVGSGAVLGSIV